MERGPHARPSPWPWLCLCALVGVGSLAAPLGTRADEPNPAAPAPAAPEGLDFGPLPAFASRLHSALPGKRADAAKRQEAIDAALEWLADHQAPDGAWRPHELSWCRGVQGPAPVAGSGKPFYETGVTGLALAAFLMVGIGPSAEHPHSPNVRRALEYLVKGQDAEGCFGARLTQHYIYNHAFACLAVLEAYGMTGDRRLGESAKKGIAFCVRAQNPGAGWRYGVRPGVSDTSVTIAVGACLSVAHAINEGVLAAEGTEPLPYSDEAARWMHAWFDEMTDADSGMVGSITRGGGPARLEEAVQRFPGELVEPMTAGAMLLRRVLPPPGPPRTALEAKGVALLRGLLPDGSLTRGAIDFIYWYYGTLALSVVGGPAWDEWDTALGTALLRLQRTDGDVCNVRGSWDPIDAWGTEGGRHYATAMGVLCLAGANRYRPVPRADLVAAIKTKGLAPHYLALAARAAASLGVELDDATVLPLASHPSAYVRATAAPLLARGPVRDAALRALTALLADPTPAVCVATLRAVGAAEAWSARLVEPIAGMLGDMRMDLTPLALRTLRQAGPAAAAVALRVSPLLAHPDERVRGEALRFLWRLGGDRTALRAPLVQVLRQGMPEERALTLSVVEPAEVAAEGLAEAVRASLGSETPAVAVEAARLLRDVPADAAAVLAAASRAVSAPAHETRLAGLRLLATWPGDATLPLEAIAPLAVHGPRPQREEAVRALARAKTLTPLAYAALVAASLHPHLPLATAAQEALARSTLPPEGRARLLTLALRANPDRTLRRAALHGLEGLGGDAVPELRGLLVTGGLPDEIQADVLRLLGRVGAQSLFVVPDVLRLLEGASSPVVRRAAADALGEPGLSEAGAVAYVVRGIGDRDLDVVQACGRALVRLARREDEAAREVQRLLKYTGKEPPAAVKAMLGELARWPDAVGHVAPTLVDLLGYEHTDVAFPAADALAMLGPEALKLLLPVIDPKTGKSSDPRAERVAYVLGKIGPAASPAVPSLLSMLTVRMSGAAADALGAIGKSAVPSLLRALGNESPRVRGLAARGLGRAGSESSSAVAALKRALKDPDPYVRGEAEAALKRLK